MVEDITLLYMSTIRLSLQTNPQNRGKFYQGRIFPLTSVKHQLVRHPRIKIWCRDIRWNGHPFLGQQWHLAQFWYFYSNFFFITFLVQEFKSALKEDAVDYTTYTANIKRKRPTPRKTKYGRMNGDGDGDDDDDDADWKGGVRRQGGSGRRGSYGRAGRQRW